MCSTTPTAAIQTQRQSGVKKPHVVRRSRAGCRNCKLRKIKCDQDKPQCQCCLTYGVVCNYAKNIPDLKQLDEAQSRWEEMINKYSLLEETPSTALQGPISTEVALESSPVPLKLDVGSVRLINQLYHQMKSRVSFPVGEIFQLSQGHAFLMHAILALSVAYDRCLSLSQKPPKVRTVREIGHFFQSTALLGQKLYQTINPSDRDPIWATASFLSILAFLAFDESNPAKAWPFKGSDSEDMNWLRIGDTKWKLFQLTQPSRPDSVFHPISSMYESMHTYILASGIDTVAPPLQKACRLHEWCPPETSPYFHAAQIVTRLDSWQDSEIPFPESMAFVVHAQSPFKTLLLDKDPAALLLLALWYSKTSKTIWWISLRGATELDAISMYLRQYHSDNSIIMSLLPSSAGGSDSENRKYQQPV